MDSTHYGKGSEENHKEEMRIYAYAHEIYFDSKINGKEINSYSPQYLKELEGKIQDFIESHPAYRKDPVISEEFNTAKSKLEKTLKDKEEN